MHLSYTLVDKIFCECQLITASIANKTVCALCDAEYITKTNAKMYTKKDVEAKWTKTHLDHDFLVVKWAILQTQEGGMEKAVNDLLDKYAMERKQRHIESDMDHNEFSQKYEELKTQRDMFMKESTLRKMVYDRNMTDWTEKRDASELAWTLVPPQLKKKPDMQARRAFELKYEASELHKIFPELDKSSDLLDQANTVDIQMRNLSKRHIRDESARENALLDMQERVLLGLVDCEIYTDKLVTKMRAQLFTWVRLAKKRMLGQEDLIAFQKVADDVWAGLCVVNVLETAWDIWVGDQEVDSD